MIVVTAKMSPRHNIIVINNGKGPSQPNEKTTNILDTTQALEIVASLLVETLVNVRGERTPNRSNRCSLKEFYEEGNLNSE